MDDHARALIGLSALLSFGPVRLRQLLTRFGTVDALWSATERDFRRFQVTDDVAERFLRERAAVPIDALESECVRNGIRVIGTDAVDYPELLREIPDAPTCLFVRGALHAIRLMIAVVGTRRSTSYGERVTREIVTALARSDVGIVSGLALGIDRIAHESALRANGYTIAVLACGVERVFPASHTGLGEDILRHGGALVSEFPPGTPALKHHFPIRNRIIAGLASGTLVTEAPERSGALLTARNALEYNRDVFAIPGQITTASSRGANRLIRDGAVLVEDASSILSAYAISGAPQKTERNETLTDDERMVFVALEEEPLTVDQIRNRCRLNTSVINATLVCLQLKGCVVQIDPLHFARNR